MVTLVSFPNVSRDDCSWGFRRLKMSEPGLSNSPASQSPEKPWQKLDKRSEMRNNPIALVCQSRWRGGGYISLLISIWLLKPLRPLQIIYFKHSFLLGNRRVDGVDGKCCVRAFDDCGGNGVRKISCPPSASVDFCCLAVRSTRVAIKFKSLLNAV